MKSLFDWSRQFRRPGGHNKIKRCIDAALAALALVVLSPLLTAAAIGIVLSGGDGPVLYRARRMARDRRRPANPSREWSLPERRRSDGYHGREFTLYKLRTMR